MSILEGKNILVVGDETSQIHNVESVLEQEGMHVHPTTCAMVSLESIAHDHVDMVLLNHLHEGAACTEMLSELRKRRMHQVLPIIALVENTPSKIDEALSLGAADYITSDEPIDSVVHKMKAILGEPETFSAPDMLDLNSGTHVTVTKTDSSRIFVIEDDPLLRNLISMRLEKTGLNFEINTGEKDALESLQEFKPDILILDLMLPGHDGFVILEQIRSSADETIKTLPVIVFSNRDSQEDRQRAINLGISGYYVKAMTDLSELMESINNVIQKSN